MIEVMNVTKRYGSFKAADNVSLTALPGNVTVLLGPNGAGKSTTIKSIANLLQFEGKVNICGFPNDTVEAKQCFGYIPEMPVLYDLFTIDEHIDFIARAYRKKDYQALADQYLTLFDLQDKRKKMAKELSKGMKQKLSMMLALIIEPKALLVDEPMIGLDPASIEETLHLFTRLKQQGCAIFISTHIIDVIDDLWDEAYIMNKGQIIQKVSRKDIGEESLKDIFFACTQEGQ